MTPHDDRTTEILELKSRIEQLENQRAELDHRHNSRMGSEQLYRTIFDSANDGIIIHDTHGRILDINRTMQQRLGFSRSEMLRMNLKDLVASGNELMIRGRTERLEQDGVAVFESADRRKDGSVIPVEVSARIITYQGIKAILSVVRDIHARKTAEALIQGALDDKEMLLEELKRRVIDSHQLFVRVLENLSRASARGIDPGLIQSQIRRIRTQSYIQHKIYEVTNVRNIDFSEITDLLVRYLINLNATEWHHIIVFREIGEFEPDLRTAVTLAHILIELVGNALDHAFPEGREGHVRIRLSPGNSGGGILAVKDNGVGCPDSLDIRKPEGLGLSLVRDMVDQLGGRLSLRRRRGTEVIVRFP